MSGQKPLSPSPPAITIEGPCTSGLLLQIFFMHIWNYLCCMGYSCCRFHEASLYLLPCSWSPFSHLPRSTEMSRLIFSARCQKHWLWVSKESRIWLCGKYIGGKCKFIALVLRNWVSLYFSKAQIYCCVAEVRKHSWVLDWSPLVFLSV